MSKFRFLFYSNCELEINIVQITLVILVSLINFYNSYSNYGSPGKWDDGWCSDKNYAACQVHSCPHTGCENLKTPGTNDPIVTTDTIVTNDSSLSTLTSTNENVIEPSGDGVVTSGAKCQSLHESFFALCTTLYIMMSS